MTTAKPRPTRSPWNRKNPFPARVVENSVLSGDGSEKEVRHYVFELGDSGITYEPGDGINVRPVNDPQLVDAVIGRLGVDSETPIPERDGSTTPLSELLAHRYEIRTPSRDLIEAVAEHTSHDELTGVLSAEDRAKLDEWLWGKDVLDLLDLDPELALHPEVFVKLLDPLQHRTYSISSSPLTHGDEVHATVTSVRYTHDDRDRGGVCSTFLADRVDEGATAGVFIAKNNSFRLPADDSIATIMVGPGTGIAPFRAFLHERQARGASGRNWLFFGDQRRESDFIYEEELDELTRDGILTRLDLAFSRDQAEKVYVQDRMRENGAELFAWLEAGAYFYVCGDATYMAKDVDQTLQEIVIEHGGLDADAAAEYVATLRRDKRYLRDVY